MHIDLELWLRAGIDHSMSILDLDRVKGKASFARGGLESLLRKQRREEIPESSKAGHGVLFRFQTHHPNVAAD